MGLGIALYAVPTALLVPVARRGAARLMWLGWVVVLGGSCAVAWLDAVGLIGDPDVHRLAFAAGATVGFGGTLLWRSRQARRLGSAPKQGVPLLDYLLAAILLALFLECVRAPSDRLPAPRAAIALAG